MMELYYSPLACSLAAHIVCREAKIPITMRRTDLATKAVRDGAPITEKNSLGQVPTLVLDDGRVLTENAAVLLFLGDFASAARLAPAPDSFERYEVIRALSFVATELHKKINAPIFGLGSPREVQEHARAMSGKSLAHLEERLRDREFFVGASFGVADAYLFWALTIMPFGGVSFDPYPAVRDYQARHAKREAARAALSQERREWQEANG